MVFKRVLLDQIAFAPFGLCLFFGSIGILEGRDFEGIKQKFEEVKEIGKHGLDTGVTKCVAYACFLKDGYFMKRVGLAILRFCKKK